MKRTFGVLMTILLVASTASAVLDGTGEKLAVKVAKVLTMDKSDTVMNNAVVLVSGGKIEKILSAKEAIPEGYRVIDQSTRWLVPGFIDCHDHVAGALFDLNDGVWLTNPGLRSLDVVSPENDNLKRAIAGGVTTVLLIPGSGNNMSGFGTVTRTVGKSQEEMLVKYPGSLKIAQAGNPERWYWNPQRSYMNYNLRQTLQKAREYHASWEAFESGKTKDKPAKNPTWEPYRGLFRKDFVVSVHTQMFQVFSMTVTMLVDEFNLRVMPDHTDFDDYKATSLAVERDMYVICGPRIWWMDGRERSIMGACAGHWRGGLRKVGVNTDAPVVAQEELTLQAAMNVRFGWESYPALLGLTRIPAEALGIDDRFGTIEKGKEADFCIWTGDPLDPRSSCELAVVAGKVAYDAAVERRF